MNKYELAVVVSAKLGEDERAAVIDKCKEYIARFGGNVTGVETDQNARKLAYEIQKQTEAFYSFIQFESDKSETPVELENRLALREDLLRFLCVRADEA
ncbi:MAG: 30S ribosomal protein S6 [Lachnospiraceae bacterium]|nr:30S ribosomal protein S6 [Lachnospiraceae bacterium]